MVIQRLKPPVQNKLKAHYFDRYANSIEDAKVLSSVGDQSRDVQVGRCYETNAGAGVVRCAFPSSGIISRQLGEGLTLSFWATYPSFAGSVRTEQGNFAFNSVGNDINNLIQFGYSGNNGGTSYSMQWQTRDAANNIYRLRMVDNITPKNEFNLWVFRMINNGDGTIKKEIWVDNVLKVQETVPENIAGSNSNNSLMDWDKYVGLGSTKLFDIRYFREAISDDDKLNLFEHKPISANPIVWYKCDESAGTKSYDSSGNNNHGTITNASLTTFHTTQDIYSFQNELGYSTGKSFSIKPTDIKDPTTAAYSYTNSNNREYSFNISEDEDNGGFDPDGNSIGYTSDYFNFYKANYGSSGSSAITVYGSFDSNTIKLDLRVLQGNITQLNGQDHRLDARFRGLMFNNYGTGTNSFSNLGQFFYAISGTDTTYGEAYPESIGYPAGTTCADIRNLLTEAGLDNVPAFISAVETVGNFTYQNWWLALQKSWGTSTNYFNSTRQVRSLNTSDLKAGGSVAGLSGTYFANYNSTLESFYALNFRCKPNTWAHIYGLSIQENHLVPASVTNPTKDVLGDTLEYKGQVSYPALLKQSNCLNFDGVDDFIETNIKVDFIHQTGEFEIEFYASFDNYQVSRVDTILSTLWSIITDPLVNDGGFRIGYGNSYSSGLNNGRIYFVLNNGSYIVRSDIFYSNEIQHIRIIGDGSIIQIFRNGIDVTENSPENTSNTMVLKSGTSPYTLSFGRAYDNTEHYHKGKLFDVKIKDGSGNLVAHYPMAEGAGTRIYDVAGGNHGTLMNASQTSIWSKQDEYHYNIQHQFTKGLRIDNQFVPFTGVTIPVNSVVTYEAVFIVSSSIFLLGNKTAYGFMFSHSSTNGRTELRYRSGGSLFVHSFDFLGTQTIGDIVKITAKVNSPSNVVFSAHNLTTGVNYNDQPSSQVGSFPVDAFFDCIGRNGGETPLNSTTIFSIKVVADDVVIIDKSFQDVPAITSSVKIGNGINADLSGLRFHYLPKIYTGLSSSKVGRFHNGAETQIDFSGGIASPYAKNLPTAYKFGDTTIPLEKSDREANILVYKDLLTPSKTFNYLKYNVYDLNGTNFTGWGFQAFGMNQDEDKVLKVWALGGEGHKVFINSYILEPNKYNKVKLTYYMPSSNTNLKGFAMYQNGLNGVAGFPARINSNIIYDQWVEIETPFFPTSGSQLRVHGLNALADRTMIGAGVETDDLLYIKDMTVITKTI